MKRSPLPVIEDERTIPTKPAALEGVADLFVVRHEACFWP